MKIEFDHIFKSFGKTEVLHDVSFTVQDGQILALLGENGAGKSTLMNILGGLFPPVSGQVLIDGQPVQLHSPNDSIEHGIAFIHQELSPVNDLRVYENMFLGREERNAFGWLNRESMRAQARKILDSLGIAIDEQSYMRDLGASHKQIVEISRALLCEAKTIIMDEPTTSLAEHEIDLLFELVRKLSAQGVNIIFISHKLNEVKTLCTHYVVLRNGWKVAEGDMKDVETQTLSELIVGRELAHMQKAEPQKHEKEILRVENLSRGKDFQNISFTAKAGEILGFTGLLGDGRSELFRSIFGDTSDYTGDIFLNGEKYHAKSTTAALKKRIAYVPSNRKENAIIPDLSVKTNGTLATLKRYCKFFLLQNAPQHDDFATHAADFRIKYADENDLITTLSGGNQQKVILARWINTKPQVLILDNPTQGVDIGAKQEIYEIVKKIAQSGVAIIVLSGEGQEIVRLCERTLVMFHGKIAGELSGDALNEQEIMKLATGANLI